MAIEIVDFPIKNGDFPWQNVSSPEGKSKIVLVHPPFSVASLLESASQLASGLQPAYSW